MVAIPIGSGTGMKLQDTEAPVEIMITSTPISLFGCASELVYSKFLRKYPDLKIALSEGGIGWVAGLIDRCDNIMARSGYGSGWPDKDLGPSDVLRRNFWFCMIDDPSSVSTRYAIGVDNICCESDYPHGDGTWPDTQPVLKKLLGDLSADEIRKMTHENAAHLYRHPLPEVRIP